MGTVAGAKSDGTGKRAEQDEAYSKALHTLKPIGGNSSSAERWNDVPHGTMDEISSHVRLDLVIRRQGRPLDCSTSCLPTPARGGLLATPQSDHRGIVRSGKPGQLQNAA